MMFESSSKNSAFQIPEATDENDLETAMVVFTWGNTY